MIVDDDRHWQGVREILKKEFKILPDSYLSELWNLNIQNYDEQIKDIGEQSKQEAKMKIALDKIKETWDKTVFEMIKHKNTDVFKLKIDEESFETLEDHQVQASTMAASKFQDYFEKTVSYWIKALGTINEIMELLGEVQKKWSFLENLFIHSEEVKKELPTESETFVGIDV